MQKLTEPKRNEMKFFENTVSYGSVSRGSPLLQVSLRVK